MRIHDFLRNAGQKGLKGKTGARQDVAKENNRWVKRSAEP
jgi:hypothetical protein